MNETNTVSIIVLNWNDWEDTISCLKSLKNITRPNPRIILVDNGSTDESLSAFKKAKNNSDLPPFEILENEKNLGFGGGVNIGIKKALKANAEWILLLNNDTVVSPDFLEILLSAAEKDKKIGLLNPKILMAEDRDKIWFIGGKFNKLLTKGFHINYGDKDAGQFDEQETQKTDYATGGCLLIKRGVIEKIGLLPEAYFMYYEDAEWSLRAKKAGFKSVVVPKSKIWHKGAASSKEFSPSYIRYHVRNGLLFNRRMGNPLQIIFAYGISVLRAFWQIIKIIFTPTKRVWAISILLGLKDAWLFRTGEIIYIKKQRVA